MRGQIDSEKSCAISLWPDDTTGAATSGSAFQLAKPLAVE
jgi:hypothetical protein